MKTLLRELLFQKREDPLLVVIFTLLRKRHLNWFWCWLNKEQMLELHIISMEMFSLETTDVWGQLKGEIIVFAKTK